MDNQPLTTDMNWLYARGYTVRQAASKLGVSYSHLAYVLRGKRTSKTLVSRVRKLPRRPLVLRERCSR